MKGEHVLEHELRGILLISVDVALIIEADHVPSFGEQTFSPTSKTTVEIDG